MLKRRTDRDHDLALAEAGIPVWSPGPRGPARIYKNRGHQGARKAPKCVACFPGSRAGQRVPLPYGVSLVLCSQHRDPRFVASRSGRDFLAAIGELYSGLGLTARRYGEALRRFVQQCTNPDKPRRHRPGSYAHAKRRQDAERIWAAGGSSEAGLAVALANPPPDLYGFRLPDPRTVRRWWLERRWLGPPVGRRPDDGQSVAVAA
jgi:hypothetical protein